MRIGVISDTHGLMRPEALASLKGADHILHAGDIGDPKILDSLRKLAPVTAIRGNIDISGTCAQLPKTELVELGRVHIYLLHNLTELDLDPTAACISVVISGHTHKPNIEHRKDVLYFNPGSAGPRRFSLPITLGFLDLNGGHLTPKLLDLITKHDFNYY